MDAKKYKKMQKRTGKLADLVCTKEFFLYKSGQVRPKSQQAAIRLAWSLICFYLLLFGHMTSVVKCHQTTPKGNDFC
jgi:hypothetical protein